MTRHSILATLALTIGIAFTTVGMTAEPKAGEQVEQSFKAKDGGEVGYLLYLPENYKTGGDKLPIMLFLHGRGESNGPLNIVAKWGPPQMAARGEELPFIVVSPQCPKEDNWSSPTQQTRLTELLADVIAKTGADTKRVYLAGLSMGGSGSWRMACDQPKRFAAVVPICGRGDVKEADKLKSLPVWVWCGDQDGVYQADVEMVEAVRKAGNTTIRFTTLENIGHNSWSAAFSSPDLFAWMLKQSIAD